MDELIPPSELCRNYCHDGEAVVDQAVWLIDHMCEHIGIADLGEMDVLDVGCGVRFSQAFVNRRLPVRSYVGVDVSREYYRLNAHNDLYNPDGIPLAELSVTEIDGRQFDVICLFSVFTHLAPADYASMLRLLRRYVKPSGRLFFTLFVDERTESGYGFMSRLLDEMDSSDDPAVKAAVEAGQSEATSVPYRERIPDQPLVVALYSQHHMLCAPAVT